MKPTYDDLKLENEQLRRRLDEAEQTIHAIRSGEVDAIVVSGGDRPRIYTIQSPDLPYRQIVEAMNAGTVTVNETGTIIYANKVFADMIGRPHEAVIGSLFQEHVAPDFRDAFPGFLKLSPLEKYSRHVQVITTSNQPLDVQFSASTEAVGEVLRTCIVLTDISRLMEAERQLQKAHDELESRVKERTRELAESQERYRATVASIGDAVITTDEKGVVTLLNTLAENLTGWSTEEAKDQPLDKVFHIIDEQTRKKGQNPVSRVLREGRVMGLANHTALISRDGSEISIEDSAAPITDAEGKLRGVVMVFRDATEKRKAETALRRSEESLRKARDELGIRVQERTAELESAYRKLVDETNERHRLEEQLRQAQKMEAIGTLAGGIAHDFNNMLAVILGNAELILDEMDGSNGDIDAGRRNADQIIKAAKRSRDLIKQILTFSRKSESPKRQDLNLAPLLKESITMLQGVMPSSITINVEISTDTDTILGDASQIQQILMNLASNAMYAMREEGGTFTVSLSQVEFTKGTPIPGDLQPGRYAKLTISDTGPGMAENIRNRIFEPFFTTKEAGEGTGMGLAVVWGIVQNHDGTITVDSEPGKGAAFNIFFPAKEKKSEESQELVVLQKGNEKILLVDDEPSVLEMAARMLAGLGYEVTTALSGTQGLRMFEQNHFDLVITDQVMPEMTGMRLAERILQERPDTPIILFTGYSETVSPEVTKQAGISEFVVKPVAKRELAEAVRKALDSINTE